MKAVSTCIIFIGFLLFGCGGNPSNLLAYTNWFSDKNNGYIKTKQVGSIVYKVIYTPAEYLMSQELEDNVQYKKEELALKLKELKEGRNFILQVGFSPDEDAKAENLIAAKIKNYDQYKKIITDLSFNIESNASLVSGSDTIYPSIYHFERGYELAKSQTFLFSFPVLNEIDDMTFIFDDPMFETGINKFQFNNLKRIPPLPINYK